MPGKGPGPSIKNEPAYEAIKKKLKAEHPGWSEDRIQEHAARISNAGAMNKFIRRKR
jgi:hypothetical protein